MKLLKTKRFLMELIREIKNKLIQKKPTQNKKKLARNKYGFPELH
jgi:hypothetical protein